MAEALVFLDVDNVLNDAVLEASLLETWPLVTKAEEEELARWQESWWCPWLPRQERTRGRKLTYLRFLDPAKIQLLQRTVSTAEASLVVSSDWRKRLSLEGLQAVLGRLGVDPASILDTTPIFGGHSRGTEILTYLNAHPEVRRAVILDDRDDMGLLAPLLVQTHKQHGLTEQLAHLALDKLHQQAVAPLGWRSFLPLL